MRTQTQSSSESVQSQQLDRKLTSHLGIRKQMEMTLVDVQIAIKMPIRVLTKVKHPRHCADTITPEASNRQNRSVRTLDAL